MKKIQRLSCIFKWLFIITFISLISLYLVRWGYFVIKNQWLFAGILHKLPKLPSHHAFISIYNKETRILCALVTLIPLSVNLIINFLLIRLFAQYQKGAVFSAKSTGTVKAIGYMLLISQAANLGYQMLFNLVITWQFGPGHRFTGFVVSDTNISMVITGCVVLLISWIMAEAHKLQEDNLYTV